MINLSPLVLFQDDVLERVWVGKDILYNHLRVFNYRTFIHIPKDERFKLDDKFKQYILMGYAHEEFSYKLWDPVDKKVIRIKNIVLLKYRTIEDFEKTLQENRSLPA